MIPISKQNVQELNPAPIPGLERIREVRIGIPKPLEQELSAIFKQPRADLVEVTTTGLLHDEHVTVVHGGVHRAVHQYSSRHYSTWRSELPTKADLFQTGAFGENLSADQLDENNVCVGDLFWIGLRDRGVLLRVSEPRVPCYKLNMRFEWPKMLATVLKSARVEWQFRVLQPRHIQSGDQMELVSRPHPRWSIMNVHRVVHGRTIKTSLLEELSELDVLSPYHHELVLKRLETAWRTYTLVSATRIARRVKHLRFARKLKGEKHLYIRQLRFQPLLYTQLKFGPTESPFIRSYSIVLGDLHEFTIRGALDDNTRGGLRFIH